MTLPFDADAHVAHLAAAMGLMIDPAWQPAVVANVAATARMAALVLDFPLDEAEEPAPVFTP
jgi:hypothetical protein